MNTKRAALLAFEHVTEAISDEMPEGAELRVSLTLDYPSGCFTLSSVVKAREGK